MLRQDLGDGSWYLHGSGSGHCATMDAASRRRESSGRSLSAKLDGSPSRPTAFWRQARPVSDHLIAPHGGALVDLFASEDRCAALNAESRDWLSHDLTPRQLCDLELLVDGGFPPLTGFLGRRDYERVCAEMRLGDGILWPVPITLDVPETLASTLSAGSRLALRDEEGVMLAALDVEEVWQPDREAERHFRDVASDVRHLGRPSSERRTETTHRRARWLSLERLDHG